MEQLTVEDIQKIIPNTSAWKVLHALVDKGLINVFEDLKESYIPKKETIICLSKEFETENKLQSLFMSLSKSQKQENVLLTYLHLQKKDGHVFQKQLLEQSGSSAAVLKTMCEKGIFLPQKVQIDRVIYTEPPEKKKIELSELQLKAFNEIIVGFEDHKPVLLHGITGSGKTHIYFKLIENAIQQNKQVLYLLPEIALTTQIIIKLQQTFGNTIGVYHSKYSNHERYELWNKVKNGECKIILGARSSLFLPFNKLGLIIVDEEHDSSYKQFDPAPRYQGRDVAVYLSNLYKANIVLGTATPSLETYHNAKNNKYTYVHLTERYGNAILPDVTLIDLKQAMKEKKMNGIFSQMLIDSIQETLHKKEQIILFQNRRGYSPFIICTTCGWVPECKYCDVSLTYHKQSDKLQCHYCGNKYNYISICEACGGNQLIAKSFGTEKIEEDIKQIFPNARIARFDWDALKNKHKHTEIIQLFEQRKIDILVGTQMVVKGLDFEHVSLVGVLSADSLLSYPDYKTHERVFQLIEQVSGRAGRKEIKGKVWIQTYNTEKSIFNYIIKHDTQGFLKDELQLRKEFLYPPYSRIVKLTIKHKLEHVAEQCANEIAHALKEMPNTWVVGPAPPVVSRIKNSYLQEILIKIVKDKNIIQQVKQQVKRKVLEITATKQYANVQIVYDVDA